MGDVSSNEDGRSSVWGKGSVSAVGNVGGDRKGIVGFEHSLLK